MSDTESFESVYERLYPQLHNPCGLWKAATITEWLDDLERAHNREIAQARDPQRLRGTKPDTFDGAIEALREFRWQHATNDEDAIPYINAVKEMHERELVESLCDACEQCDRIDKQKAKQEIRDTAQREYDRGFNDGQHSMDAEHRAVAMRLRQLPLDGGSHENLSQIARAIYHADFGWTQGACASLRDELVRLMGGVSDDTCDSQCRGACAAGDCGCAGESKGIDNGDVGRCEWLRDGTASDSLIPVWPRDEKQTEVTDERLADDSGADTGCGDGCGAVHMDRLVTYDVLDNERRKAVCGLRKMPNGYPEYASAPFARWYAELCETLGIETGFGNVRDRLIHLLGGDKPSGIDVLREMDAESDADGTCPNDDTTSSITDELRKWASDRHCKGMSHTDVLNIGLIADRIDAQFDRICQQQEAVLQSIIDEVIEERKSDRLRIEKLVEQRDEARAKLDAIRDALDG